MHQPILGLDTAPRPLRLMVCACLDRPWSLLPAEPRVRPLVGHFRLAPKGTERVAQERADSISHTNCYSTTAQHELDKVNS